MREEDLEEAAEVFAQSFAQKGEPDRLLGITVESYRRGGGAAAEKGGGEKGRTQKGLAFFSNDWMNLLLRRMTADH